MNQIKPSSGLQLHSKLISELIRLSNKNISDVIRAVTSSYGITAYRIAGEFFRLTYRQELKIALLSSAQEL